MDIDFLLIQKMKHGDEHAFDLFVRKYYEKILKYCRYHCSDLSYAEDLTQETFLRFFEKLSDYRFMGKTGNYLYTIAGNLCKDYARKKKEYPKDKSSREIPSSPEPPETDRLLNQITLNAALDRLPKELREVLILYYFQELKILEISRILNIGVPLVKYRIRQAKSRLKKLWKEE